MQHCCSSFRFFKPLQYITPSHSQRVRCCGLFSRLALLTIRRASSSLSQFYFLFWAFLFSPNVYTRSSLPSLPPPSLLPPLSPFLRSSVTIRIFLWCFPIDRILKLELSEKRRHSECVT